MVKEDLLKPNLITAETFQEIEDGILKFCAGWIYIVKNHKDKYTFTFENDEEIVRDTCGTEGLAKYRRYKVEKGIRNAAVTSAKSIWGGVLRIFGKR